MKGLVKNIFVYSNAGEILNKFKYEGFLPFSLSTYDFTSNNNIINWTNV